MMSFVMILIIASIIAFASSTNFQNPTVHTPLGVIEGSLLQTRLGKTIYAFRGIRYAQPPTGNLRFKAPLPVEEWSDIYNAIEDGPVCPQPTDDPMSEDCLFLNVYSTELPNGANPHRPIIVYLHSGGFYSVTGRSDWAGPQYFLDQNIVFVTLNYRLGTLGFLSLGETAPGNFGLKDQVLALKWIQKNIESFGGDPNSVTLFGYSAGSWSVSLHLVSPMSRGLFHRAIMGSGAVTGQIKIPNSQEILARKQALLLGCPDNGTLETVFDCLKNAPAEDLGNSLGGFVEFSQNDPIFIWYPVVEDDYGQERFLSEDPIKLIERGDFAQVPIIAGITKDEFAMNGFFTVGNTTALSQMNNNFDLYAPVAFLYERGTLKSKEISANIRNFYFSAESLSNSSLSGFTKVYADAITGFSVNRFVNLISKKGREKVYYYEFSYQGRYSHFYLPGSDNIPYGVVHHDDLIYLLYINPIFPFFDDSYPEKEMVEKLTTLWANFASTGEPIPESGELFAGITWEPFNFSSRKYLEIGNKIALREELNQNRYDLWTKLFPLEN